tara:strand:+ start:205 stop:972 length:768 start_codon:yes stop_codon:yes gene_type:complete
MGFKLGSERRKMNIPNGKTPIVRKNLAPGVHAEANNDGSIFVDKKIPVNSNRFKKSIAHELQHIKDIDSGKANYGDEWVEWEGNIYIRKTIDGKKFIDGPAGRLPEGHPNHPWEKSAIDAERKNVNVTMGDGGLEAGYGEDGESPLKFWKKLKKAAKFAVQNNPISMATRAIKGDDVIRTDALTGGKGIEGEVAEEGGDPRDGDARAAAKKKHEEMRNKLFGGGIGGMFGAGFAFQKMKQRAAENDGDHGVGTMV